MTASGIDRAIEELRYLRERQEREQEIRRAFPYATMDQVQKVEDVMEATGMSAEQVRDLVVILWPAL